MPITWYNTTGQPADTVGADGDWAIDSANTARPSYWGPKTSGTWAQTQRSLVGASGAPLLPAVGGTPGSAFGQNGQIAMDPANGNTFLKSNNVWAQQGQIVGATGPAGPSMLNALCAANGLLAFYANTGSLAASTVTPFTFQGSSTNYSFTPPSASAFMGFTYQGGSAQTTANITFTLYDVTAGSPVYSLTVPYTSSGYIFGNTGLFSLTQYPLQANHTYTWQFSSSVALSNMAFFVTPVYAMPSNSVGPCVSPSFPLGFSTSTSIPTSNIAIPLYGTANNAYLYPIRSGGNYAMQAQLTATGSTATTATALFYVYYVPNAGGSTSTLGGFPVTLTADGVMRTVYMPSGGNDAAYNPTYRFFFQIKGNVAMTATLLINPYVVV